jgi:hypothetical protein
VTILPSNSQGPQVPIRVSRPAWKLWKYLEALYRIGGWISPKLRHLADKFGRAVSTIKRWMGELFAAGILSTRRRGPRPPLYTVLIPTTDTCKRVRPYINSQGVKEPSGEQTPPLAQKVAEWFGNTELGGKRADPALISRVARLVRDFSGLDRLKANSFRWLRRGNRLQGWGIFVTLAEDVQRGLVPIVPAPQPIHQKPPILPQPQIIPSPVTQRVPVQTERSLLAGLGINADKFAFGRR